MNKKIKKIRKKEKKKKKVTSCFASRRLKMVLQERAERIIPKPADDT